MARIIHLLNHCRFGHGNVHAAIDLASAQVRQGDVVAFACGPGEFDPLLAQLGIPRFPLEQERRGPVSTARAAIDLFRLIRRFKPDILHAHMVTGAVLGAAVGRLTGVPLVTTVHNSFDGHARLMGLGHRVVAVSDPVSRQMEGRGVPAARLRTVLNGTIDAPRRDFFGSTPMTWPRPSLSTICGLHDRKGVRDLIAAFDIVSRRHPTAHLNIIGDGPDRQAYEALAAALPHAARIRFHGQLHDTKSALAATDIFVLASHAEPFGLVLSEAREAGCAIVATDVDGIPQALEGGTAGKLVPPRDPPAMAAAILTLLESAPAMAAAKAAGQHNLGYWTIDRVARDTRAVYRELLSA